MTELGTPLLEAREERQLARVRWLLVWLDPLALDELDHVPVSEVGAELLFDAIVTAYERDGVVEATNLPFEKWREVLGGEWLMSARLDRLTHRRQILKMSSEGYWLEEARRRRRAGAGVGDPIAR